MTTLKKKEYNKEYKEVYLELEPWYRKEIQSCQERGPGDVCHSGLKRFNLTPPPPPLQKEKIKKERKKKKKRK